MTRNFIYSDIFLTNVLRILEERNITQKTLADRAGISTAFISDIVKGQGNPSIHTMEAISIALDVSLPYLLDTTDLDPKLLNELAGGTLKPSLPAGYQRVSYVLTDFQAYIAGEWDTNNRKKIRGPYAPRKRRSKPPHL